MQGTRDVQKALTLLYDTEAAVRTFQRTHRWRAAGKVPALSSLTALLV